jgi:DHA2 family multidrug resistance protein
MFVTLTTMSLSTVARADMTDASSLYTLSRRIGGNIGYALVATLVARGEQIHRVQMAANVTPYNPNLAEFQRHVSGFLGHAGLSAGALEHTGQALLNLLINRQATMMAYNDVSWIFGLLFLATMPLALLLPSRRKIALEQKLQGDY